MVRPPDLLQQERGPLRFEGPTLKRSLFVVKEFSSYPHPDGIPIFLNVNYRRTSISLRGEMAATRNQNGFVADAKEGMEGMY